MAIFNSYVSLPEGNGLNGAKLYPRNICRRTEFEISKNCRSLKIPSKNTFWVGIAIEGDMPWNVSLSRGLRFVFILETWEYYPLVI